MKLGTPLALLTVACALVGCRAVEPPSRVPLSGTASSARWFLHPQQPLVPAASAALPGGATLYAGPDGTRWLQSGASATPAEEVLDAKLVGVATLAGGGVALRGDDGTVYSARAPLAPVETIQPAREPLRATAPPPPHPLRLTTSVPGALQGAYAVRAGRGAVVGGRWLEVAPDSRDRWVLQRSELGSPVHTAAMPALDGCALAGLAAEGHDAWLACTPRSDATVVRVFLSDDGGARWRAGPTLRAAEADAVRLFALARGEVLVQGACRTDDAAPCTGTSRVILGPAGPRGVRVDASMSLYTVRRAPDGALYALATAGTGITYLLASRDGGASFSTLELPLLEACGCSPTGEASGLAAGDGGEVVVVAYANADRWLRYVSVDHGAHVSVTRMAIQPDAVDLAGRRGLAYGPTGGWETDDLGVTWVPVAVPWSLEVEATKKTQLACSAEGCLVNADATRMGWTRR